ncbi:MAG: MFS transporter [Phycisphaerales bacterium]|nr:MAG: MFS transporter [Phycisphaerales bacterium]
MAFTLAPEYRRWRYRVCAISWLAYAGLYLCRKNFSIAMPLLNRDLGFTKDNFALVLFLYSLFYALGQFYNGFLSDRFGPRLVVGFGLFLSILASVFMGFSAALLLFGWDSLFYFLATIVPIAGCLLAVKWSWVPEVHKPAIKSEESKG